MGRRRAPFWWKITPDFRRAVPGPELSQAMEKQAKNFGLIIESGEVSALRPVGNLWEIEATGRKILSQSSNCCQRRGAKQIGSSGRRRTEGKRGFVLCHLRRPIFSGPGNWGDWRRRLGCRRSPVSDPICQEGRISSTGATLSGPKRSFRTGPSKTRKSKSSGIRSLRKYMGKTAWTVWRLRM